ncbi:DUF4926 domain-containing protein [Roseofilum sp. BLCC_M154]|jgi:hypothetical protein|uniref:DUF4926 domain-containing protein n=1 Tax=Roseofilum acuticapitatum BLCC-M154 TaxID=3022444 RepID=A0ABT7AUG7_9CYAN|nr:DUF4926 domain-containing protein [Roseofilum acuticapitatum]MDJ1170530.1 DUF4926 domain-containing protein [Roseofilum acuticapitatum BLCC-M154]
MKPELFDLVELLIDLPEYHLFIGDRGAVVECLDDTHFEIEFSNPDGETTALCPLSTEQFMVVWQSETKQWLATGDKIKWMSDRLSEEKQEELLNFARFLYQKA